MQVNEIAEEISESKEMIPQKPKGKEKGFLSAKKRDILFYCLISAFPLLQFSIFYLGVNVNSFLLAFKSYDAFTGVMTWVGFDNIVEALRAMTSQYELVTAAKNSIIAYVCGLVVGVPLALLFSYYIYKKKFLGGFFRVILFLPSILSAIAMSVIFYYFAERALPAYTATDAHGLTARVSRTITISDQTAPVLSTFEFPETATVGEEISLPTVTATDDVTESVNVTLTITLNGEEISVEGSTFIPEEVGTYTFVWEASDAAGNPVSVTRELTVNEQTNATVWIIVGVVAAVVVIGVVVAVLVIKKKKKA